MNLELSLDSILKIVNAILGLIRRLMDNGMLEGII